MKNLKKVTMFSKQNMIWNEKFEDGVDVAHDYSGMDRLSRYLRRKVFEEKFKLDDELFNLESEIEFDDDAGIPITKEFYQNYKNTVSRYERLVDLTLRLNMHNMRFNMMKQRIIKVFKERQIHVSVFKDLKSHRTDKNINYFSIADRVSMSEFKTYTSINIKENDI